MDANKAQKLRDIRYAWAETCENCEFSNIANMTEFGVCTKYTYKHLKHSGDERQLSISRFGWCPSWAPSERYSRSVSSFPF